MGIKVPKIGSGGLGIKPYKGPKPRFSLAENPKKFARGMDPVSATKKLFMYKDIFGNMGGPPKMDMSPPKAGLGAGLPGGKKDNTPGGTGNIQLITAARRMGLL
jgi:hypothetical protein